jgi:hypothetical protein
MTDTSDLDDLEQVRTGLAKQADGIIEHETEWPELGAGLDASHYAHKDPYPDWHTGTDFEPMLLAVLWAKTEDESVTGLSDRLADNPDIAESFGFNVDDIPHGDTFARAWRNRFEELQDRIERWGDTIDDMATKRGSPIGAGGLNAEETAGSSKRTEQRLLRKKTREVMGQMGDIVYPALNLPRPENAIFDEEEIKNAFTVTAMEGEAANNGADINGDRLDTLREPGLDDPFYVDGMTGETLLDPIHQLEVQEITDMVNRGAERALTRIKPYAEFPEPVFLAIDATYVAYYGDRDEMEWVQGAPDDKEYNWCHKFATATIVGDNVHMVVGMLPIGNANARNGNFYPGEETKSYRVGEIVRDLVSIATDHVRVKCVYADREFAAADTIAALEDHDVFYMIPAPRNPRTKRWMDDNVDVEQGILAVEQEWAMYGPVKHGASNERVETTLIGLPGDPDEDQYGFGDSDDGEESDDEPSGAVPFYTNKSVDDEIAVDRRQTKRQVERYSRRGGIETAYKKIKEFAAYTTSKDFGVRLFEFGFAVLLYNMWLLVDFLVQVGMDVPFRSKPRITAQRFIAYVRRRLNDFV